MKNYLNFNLAPKKLLPFWLLFMVFYLIPYAFLLFKLKQAETNQVPPLWSLTVVLLIFVAMILYFFLIKISIESLEYKGKSIAFDGTFGQYIGKISLGLFLSIITLGLYSPWFVRNITQFYATKSSYDTNRFKFNGEGGVLFLIITLSLILPMILTGIFSAVMGFNKSGDLLTGSIFQIAVIMILVPYMYLIYRWAFNFDFKDYHIAWETSFINSCGKIALEIILSIITFGIYLPLAYIRLYKYFVERTVATSPENKLRFGYDIESGKDFLFLWGQIFLCIITLTIYTPWAWSKIGRRFIGKTYLA